MNESMSRPTSSPFAGKCSFPVKTMLTDEMEEDLKRFAQLHGYPSVSDCLRELIAVALYGRDTLSNVHRDRINALSKNMAETGQELLPRR